MILILKRIYWVFALLLLLAVPLVSYTNAQAAPNPFASCSDPGAGTNCEVIRCPDGTSDSSLCKDSNTEQSLANNSIYGPDGILTRVIKILSMIVAIAAVFVVIVGGLRYIMASGDPTNVNNAKNAILYALIGLAIAGIAQAMVIFVLNKL